MLHLKRYFILGRKGNLLDMSKTCVTVNIITRNYPPSKAITGESAMELASYLINRNCNVNIVQVDAKYAGGGAATNAVGNIYKIRTFYNGKSALIRLVANLYEGFRLVLKSKSLKPDVTICMTDPPLLNFWSAVLLRRKKWILWAMDLYPEAFVAANLISENNPVYKFIRFIIARSRPFHVIALGYFQAAYLRDFYGAGVGQTILPCGIFSNDSDAEERKPEWREDQDKIYLGYCGNIGEAHSLDFLLSVIDNIIPSRQRLILSVYGVHAEKIRKFAMGREGIIVLPQVKRDELKYIDIHLSSLISDWVNICVPSKTVSAVCSGAAFLYHGVEFSDNWKLLGRAGWRIDNDDTTEAVKSFLTSLDTKLLKAKKEQALELSKEFDYLKEKSFLEIYQALV